MEMIVDDAMETEGRVSAQDTISTADRLLDLSYAQVTEIVGAFSVEYAGSAEQRQSMVDGWLVTNRSDTGSLLVHALTKWLELIRGSALTLRTRKEDPRRAKIEAQAKEIKQLKQDVEKRQRKAHTLTHT